MPTLPGADPARREPCLLSGWQKLDYLSHHQLPAKGRISRKLESRARAGDRMNPSTPKWDVDILTSLLIVDQKPYTTTWDLKQM